MVDNPFLCVNPDSYIIQKNGYDLLTLSSLPFYENNQCYCRLAAVT